MATPSSVYGRPAHPVQRILRRMAKAVTNNTLTIERAVIGAMFTLIVLGGGAWAAHINSQVTGLPASLRRLIKDHEDTPNHPGTPSVREFDDLKARLRRIESGIDELRRLR